LLVADTQIQHHLLLPKESWWFHPLRRVIFELNLRKSWHVTSYLRPDAVVFLGDMLSNGKAAKAHQEFVLFIKKFNATIPQPSSCYRYKAAVEKFVSIFHIDPRTEVYYIPGNNDVG
jgi:predicted phosphodiesterase